MLLGKKVLKWRQTRKPLLNSKQQISQTYNIQKLDTVMVAINEEFAPDSEIIQEGDTIAFIPPVSGG